MEKIQIEVKWNSKATEEDSAALTKILRSLFDTVYAGEPIPECVEEIKIQRAI